MEAEAPCPPGWRCLRDHDADELGLWAARVAQWSADAVRDCGPVVEELPPEQPKQPDDKQPAENTASRSGGDVE